jgi:hypothetical protein
MHWLHALSMEKLDLVWQGQFQGKDGHKSIILNS